MRGFDTLIFISVGMAGVIQIAYFSGKAPPVPSDGSQPGESCCRYQASPARDPFRSVPFGFVVHSAGPGALLPPGPRFAWMLDPTTTPDSPLLGVVGMSSAPPEPPGSFAWADLTSAASDNRQEVTFEANWTSPGWASGFGGSARAHGDAASPPPASPIATTPGGPPIVVTPEQLADTASRATGSPPPDPQLPEPPPTVLAGDPGPPPSGDDPGPPELIGPPSSVGSGDVPEPASLGILAIGLLGLARARRARPA
jgi:hypothetical protein